MAEAWFEEFFQGLALEVWRKAKNPEQTKVEAEFLAATLGVSKGGHVLDIPCGNGRLAVALAQRGMRMTGVDFSEEFIAEARSQVTPRQETDGKIEWVHGDMRRIDWRETFDGAYCFGNSFGYFPREETCSFLAAIHGALKPGARFVLDTSLAAESLLPGLEERSWSQVEDMLMLVERNYKVVESRLDTEYTFIHNGRSETRQASYWIFTVADILRMLQESGLEAISLFGSLEQEPYAFGAPRLLLVAEKT
jgi:SAM-dependent methyltransferase